MPYLHNLKADRVIKAFEKAGTKEPATPILDPIARLSALGEELKPDKIKDEYQSLQPSLADLYSSDRALFATATQIVKDKLGINRKDVEASLKPLLAEHPQENKPLPSAHFPTLVDLVDVWDFRRQWHEEKAQLREELLAGTYQVSLLTRVIIKNQDEVDLWAARDAVVMKALTLVLQEHLPSSPRCTHLKGHGGLKGAVRQVQQALPDHRFVLKTDVQSYYASIDHCLLMDRLAQYIKDPLILNLIGQYLTRVTERGGLYWEHRKGIALGCPLSPLIGAFFLYELDMALEKLGLFFCRYMDDILVLAPTRWKLRKAVTVVNQVLASLNLEKHPDKTFIGRIERGFEFLGYHFSPEGLCVARKTVENFVARACRLYEHEREKRTSSSALGMYVQRWIRWVCAGIPVIRKEEGPTVLGGGPQAAPRGAVWTHRTPAADTFQVAQCL